MRLVEVNEQGSGENLFSAALNMKQTNKKSVWTWRRDKNIVFYQWNYGSRLSQWGAGKQKLGNLSFAFSIYMCIFTIFMSCSDFTWDKCLFGWSPVFTSFLLLPLPTLIISMVFLSYSIKFSMSSSIIIVTYSQLPTHTEKRNEE